MTDSENSAPQDDSDEDIYDDFPEFNFEDELAKLEGSKESYKQEAQDLSDRVKKLSEENEELKKSNEVLKKNLSTLLKTAQAEIQRKDSVINELREKVESFTFRRKTKSTKDKYTTTDDLIIIPAVKRDSRSRSQKNRSRSQESCSGSDVDFKSNKLEKKKKETSGERESNAASDKNRRLGHFREITKPNFRHFSSGYDDSRDRHKESRFHRCRGKDPPDSRSSFRYNHRDNLKYDSIDKKRHSDISSYSSRRTDSRERRRDSSPERRRRKDVRRGRSRSKERSGNKDSEKPRNKSFDKDIPSKVKERTSEKITEPEPAKCTKIDDCCKQNDNLEKDKPVDNYKTDGKNSKISKEKNSSKCDKKQFLDIFETKSPLEALYSEPVTTRDTLQCFNLGAAAKNTDIEEGECTENDTETLTPQPEDWKLSFKNERKTTAQPMTLYSKRMMQRLKSERLKNKEEKKVVESEICEKFEETPKSSKVEKEPGELTDDENIVESSKEFQELTKVASIHSSLNDKPVKIVIEDSPKNESPKEDEIFKEPIQKEPLKKDKKLRNESKADEKKMKDEVITSSKEIESAKQIGDAIEFSPFKNNYKLIEISPIKLPGNERLLDLYKGNPPPKSQIQKEVESSIFNLLSSLVPPEKRNAKANKIDGLKTSTVMNEAAEKESEKKETDLLKSSGSPKDADEKPTQTKEISIEKTDLKKKDSVESKQKKKPENPEEKNKSKDENLGKGKRKCSKKEKQKPDKKSQKSENEPEVIEPKKQETKKRKREDNECMEDKSKKQKVSGKRKRSRSKTVSNSEPESTPEEKVKEDISFFEFFKPTAEKDKPEKNELDSSTDYKMTTTMSVTGVVCLETPNKGVEKLKNLMINEQMICHVLDSRSPQFSPIIASKCVEMTPRRMLKNDLMLTDSEDESGTKQEIQAGENSEGENSELESDSGASDFVDLL